MGLVEAAKRLSLPKGTLKNWIYADKQDELAGLGNAIHTRAVLTVKMHLIAQRELHASMNDWQEALLVDLRSAFLLSLDDLLVIARKFFTHDLSRSALLRCLTRHNVNNLRVLMPQSEHEDEKKKTFKDYAPGFKLSYPRQSRGFIFVSPSKGQKYEAPEGADSHT